MRVKPDQITRAIQIAKAISERIDPAFSRVAMDIDPDSPLAQRMGMLRSIKRVEPYRPTEGFSRGGYAAGGTDQDNPYSQPDDHQLEHQPVEHDYSAPNSYMNMYSKAAHVASQLPMKRATAAQWKASLLNKGVKPSEIRWSGFDEQHSADKMMSRKDVARHFDIYQPDIHETDLRGPETQYENWTIPGGKNYREVLLHEANPHEVLHQHQHWENIPNFDNEDDYDGGKETVAIPNIYVHARLKDRVYHNPNVPYPDPEKILHIEELQSDWGQDGRKRKDGTGGFRDPDPANIPQNTEAHDRFKDYVRDLSHRTGHPLDPEKPYPDVYEAAEKAGEMEHLFEHGRAVQDERRANARRMTAPVEGPYVGRTGDWLDLGLKHLLSQAASNGHEHIMWTPGHIQALRYPEDNEEKMAAREAGMRHFYDEMLPKQLLKLAQMHDPEAQLGQLEMEYSHPKDHTFVRGAFPSLRITPRMRESILKKGFPAYAKGGIVEGNDRLAAYLHGNHPLVPHVVYHGTDRNITQFEDYHPRRVDAGIDGSNTDTGWYGKGHYFTPHPGAASHFASGYTIGTEHGPNVMPVHLALKNPFIVKVPRDSSGATDMDRALDAAGAPPSSDARLVAKGRGERLPSEQTKILRDMGHDGVIVMHQFGHKDEATEKAMQDRLRAAINRHNAAKDTYYETFGQQDDPEAFESAKAEFTDSLRAMKRAREEAGGEYVPHEFVVFDPRQVKSASGNTGDFDPNDPDIRKSDGGSVDDDHDDIPNAMSVFPKPQRMWDEDMPGGAYLSMPDKQDVTGHRAAKASIGIAEGGKPYFNASRDAVEATGSPGRGSATVKTNLFKQKAGWRWIDAPEGHENTSTLVSVEHRGRHHYVLNAHFPKGVDLARYPDAPSEPRLRPTTKGNVELGPQVGSISVRGKEHPVHAHAIVKKFGGSIDGDEAVDPAIASEQDHPLTQDVYHGTKEIMVGPARAWETGQEMFQARNPKDVSFLPNVTALSLGPHVARDPNISGHFRFTTGEHPEFPDSITNPVPHKAQGKVMMLKTFPHERFYPVPQNIHEDVLSMPDYDRDDNAVHNFVFDTVLRRDPVLTKRLFGAAGADEDKAKRIASAIASSQPFEDPATPGKTHPNLMTFLRYNGLFPTAREHDLIIKQFRRILRDKGYVGLSYSNTDPSETHYAKDRTCYIVFPQRDKETGWSPLRLRGAKFDPARKGRPGLHEANGGAVEGYADGGSPLSNPMAQTAQMENAPGITVSSRPGQMGGYPVRMGVMDEHEPWHFTTPEGEEMPTPPPVQHPVLNEPRLDKVHKATAKIFKSKGFNDLLEDMTGLRDLNVRPIMGTWQGVPEPSFHISHPDMTPEHVRALAPILGFGFQQDAEVHHHHNPDPENEGVPSVYLGKDGKLSKRDLDRVLDAAKQEGIDFSQTSDGRGVKFSHFGDDGDELTRFRDSVIKVANAVNFPHRHYVRTSGELQNAQDYLPAIFGQSEGGLGEGGLHGGSARSSDLFGRIVDHVLAPYAKAVASEGYRLSPERLAETYGLTPEETEKVRSALLPTKLNRSTIPLMEGTESLDVRPTGHRGKPTVSDVLFALQNRAAAKGQIDPGDYSKEAMENIAGEAANEVEYHVNHASKSAIGWYDAALKKAMDIYYKVMPELKTDPDRQAMFKAILGITSQGQDVYANSGSTAKLYSLVRNGASLPEAVEKLKGTFGDKTRAIEINLNKLHEMSENVGGYSALEKMLNSTKTVSEWNNILRKDPNLQVSGKPLKMKGGKNQMVTGWMAFGPKIGSFINNLNGDYSTLTADLWFSRTWNRLLGHNFDHSPIAEAKQYRDFRSALAAEHAHNNPDEALEEASPHKITDGVIKMDKSGNPMDWLHGKDTAGISRDDMEQLINDPDRMLSFAKNISDVYRKGQYKQKSDLRRRAKNWLENRELPVAAPRTDLEREFQQKTIERAQQKLAKKGIDISVADIQAALWFHEKDLFGKMGVASEKAAPADYADAANKTVSDLSHLFSKPKAVGGPAINKALLVSLRATKKR